MITIKSHKYQIEFSFTEQQLKEALQINLDVMSQPIKFKLWTTTLGLCSQSDQIHIKRLAYEFYFLYLEQLEKVI